MLTTFSKISGVLGVLLALWCMGCEQRIPIGPFQNVPPATNTTDTTYAEVYPPISGYEVGGFQDPRAVMVGNDQLIYVCDYARNEVIMFDAGGRVLTSRKIMHPISIAQNSKLDLYVGAETIAPNGVDTVGAIYRIFLARFDTTYVAGYDTTIVLGDTVILPVYRDTSLFADHHLDVARSRIVWKEPGHPARRFPGIAILPGNEYLAARSGPDNSSFVDPDNRVLHFTPGDTLYSPIGDLLTPPSGGTSIVDIRFLTGIMVFPGTRNFLVTQSTSGVVYGAILLTWTNTSTQQGWIPTYDPADPIQRGADIIKPYRFRDAVAAAYDNKRRELYILDAGLDSVMKFNSRGQQKEESFGRYLTGSQGLPALSGPMGIAYSNDCTLYIIDTGNKLLRRFRIASQTNCF
ncbi:MAG TPA: hypothetical protein VMW43_11750 [Bacteroidota bacterium]|nr:hypothetical protein [Bacteroidota bacterium]